MFHRTSAPPEARSAEQAAPSDEEAAPRPQRWHSTPAGKRAGRAAAAAIPVAAVNVTAFIGQYFFLVQHVPWPTAGRLLIAFALESIAVYLAAHAHAAQMANDSSMRLKLGSYGFGLVIGGMNYSHYMAPHWRPTVMALIMLMMSAASPWLWGIHSRRASRDRLMARGLVEERAVRLGSTRWTWHPARSFWATWLATWLGETSPARAIAMADDRRMARAASRRAAIAACQERPTRHRSGPALSAAATDPAPDAPPAPAQDPEAPAPAPAPGPVPAAPVTVSAKATLRARPAMTVITDNVLRDAELALAALPVSQLPSIRAVAKDMLHSPNSRRVAERLLNERVKAEPAPQVPASADVANHRPSGLIASPASHLPGGVNGGPVG